MRRGRGRGWWWLGLWLLVGLWPLPVQAAGLLAQGSTGSEVRYLQESLAEAGFDPGPRDGIFGPRTAAAVRAFQRSRGLVVDGLVGPRTWEALEGVARRPLALGYFYGPGASESLWAYGDHLGAVADFSFQIDGQGVVHGNPSREVLAFCRERGKVAWAVVTNEGPAGFDPRMAHTLLASPVARERAVRAIRELCLEHGYRGTILDFENLAGGDRWAFTSFVKELASELHAAGLRLALALPAKVSDRSPSWNEAYDYPALAAVADYIAPMAYDYHGAGSEAGPVAPLDWVRQVASYAASVTSPRRVWLGVAAYGYEWQEGTSRGVAVPAYRARALAYQYGIPQEWDDGGQAPYFWYYRAGGRRVVYYENEYSLAPKLDLVRELGLGGITLWRLGLEVPEIWPLISARLR